MTTPSEADFAPPVALRQRRSARWPLWLALAFVVLAVGCGAFLLTNTASRELVVGTIKGGDHAYYMANDAMAPALPEGARVLTASHFGAIRRGDVVAFKPPLGSDPSFKALIKRVIGLPGETVTVQNGHVLINGRQLSETYVPAGVATECANNRPQCFATAPIPADHYWVMGDNRPTSKDSRSFGPVARADIVGVVVRILSPPSAAGAVPGSTR